jgi:hypothetical protein
MAGSRTLNTAWPVRDSDAASGCRMQRPNLGRNALGHAIQVIDLASPAVRHGPCLGGRHMPYERRRPENTTLHRVVRENLKTLYAAAEDGFAGVGLPAFVHKERELPRLRAALPRFRAPRLPELRRAAAGRI